jgi:hypothetical protein
MIRITGGLAVSRAEAGNHWGWLKFGIRILGLVLLVGWLGQRVDLEVVRASWRGLGLAEGLGIVLVFLVSMGVRAFRWWWALWGLKLAGEPVRLIRNFLWGVLAGSVTPMRVGELWKLAELGGEGALGERRILAASALALEKGMEVLVLGSFVMVGLWRDIPELWPVAVLIGLGWLFGVSLGILAFPVGWLPGKLKNLAKSLLGARDGLSFKTRLQLLGLSYLAQGLNMLGGYFVYSAFGSVPFWRFFFGMPLATFSTLIPITISGIGLRELTAMAVLGGESYTPDAAAVAASLVFLGANILPSLSVIFFELVLRLRGTP